MQPGSFSDPALAYDIDDIIPVDRTSTPKATRPVVYPLTWDDDLDKIRRPEWLIDGVLPAEGLSVLHGQPGVGKTFVGLDWALSVAQGMKWQGRRVQKGEVVYVVAEGWRGVRDRVHAWKLHNGIFTEDRAGVAFLGKPIRMLDEDDAKLFSNAVLDSGLIPDLVVIDTLARNAVGIDENSAKDMGRVVFYADYLRENLDTAVLLVHHSRKNQEGRPVMRGSSALNGASDMVALVELADPEDPTRLVLSNDKMKDGSHFSKMDLQLLPVENSVVVAAGHAPRQAKQTDLLGDFPEGFDG